MSDLPSGRPAVGVAGFGQAAWDRVGVSRALGVYTIVIEKTGQGIVSLPGTYRAGCSR